MEYFISDRFCQKDLCKTMRDFLPKKYVTLHRLKKKLKRGSKLHPLIFPCAVLSKIWAKAFLVYLGDRKGFNGGGCRLDYYNWPGKSLV